MPLTKKELDAIIKAREEVKVDLGGGDEPQPGFINIDIRDLPKVDIVHDLEVFPWPLPNDCADFLMASHIVEHIEPHKGVFIDFMNEAWRILKPGGRMFIQTPYAGTPRFYQDPTHCNPCTEITFAYFDPWIGEGMLYRIYRPKPWQIMTSRIEENGYLEVLLEKRIENPNTRRKREKLQG